MATQSYDYNAALMRRLGMIQDLGSNATELAAQRAANRPSQWLQNMPQPNLPNGANPSQYPKGDFGKFLNAIAGQESGGKYDIQNSSSGAMGKYQIMPSNIMGTGKGWDYEALGRDVNIGQFLASPQIQESIAQYKLKSYYDKYGPAGAAVAWYAGPGTVSNYLKNPNRYTNPQGAYPSIAAYVQQVLGRM
jgi:hypothetical protein